MPSRARSAVAGSIGAGSSRIAPASELLYRMVCHSAGSWRTSREGANDSYCPWCTPYRRKALNDIDTVCGDMSLIDGVELSLETIDGHGAHLKMSHDNDTIRPLPSVSIQLFRSRIRLSYKP